MVQTRVVSESFDLYPANTSQSGFGLTSVWNAFAGIAPGRFSGQAMAVTNIGSPYRVFPDNTKGVVGFAVNINAFSAGTNSLITLGNVDGGAQVSLIVTSAGLLKLVRGSNNDGAMVSISNYPQIQLNVWHYVELAWFIDDNTGTLDVRVDGISVAEMHYTGDTRLTTDGTNVGRFTINSNGGIQYFLFDDLYIETGGNAFVGEGRFEVLPVIADVSTTGFTPSTGANLYNVLANIPVGNLYYAQATDTGSIMRLAHKPLQTAPQAIYGVQLISLSDKTEAGTRTSRNVLWSSDATFDGATDALNLNSFTLKQDWLAVDPKTSAAWLAAAVNASNIGVELVL